MCPIDIQNILIMKLLTKKKKITLEYENYVRMTEFYKFPKQSKNIQIDLIKNKIMKINKLEKSYFTMVCTKKLNNFFVTNKQKIDFFIFMEKN